MARVDFYHLTRTRLEATLPKLLEKVLDSGKRAVVLTSSAERAEALAAHLWTYDDRSFLPHGTAKDGSPNRQPVWLTDTEENPNGATFLVLTEGRKPSALDEYERCLDLFDGNDEDAVAAARRRWKELKESGHEIHYHQQTDSGGWEEKA